jgi:hypothetical protein
MLLTDELLEQVQSSHSDNPKRIYNIRPCPQCSHAMYGMPGGHDAHCANCGYKDPCCGD